jgi:hypothetical protein
VKNHVRVCGPLLEFNRIAFAVHLLLFLGTLLIAAPLIAAENLLIVDVYDEGKQNPELQAEVERLAQALPTELYRKLHGTPDLAFMLDKPRVGGTVRIPKKQPFFWLSKWHKPTHIACNHRRYGRSRPALQSSSPIRGSG